MKCFAHFCNYKDGHDEKRSLFRFPKDSAVRKEWLSFCEVDLNFQIKPSDLAIKHSNFYLYKLLQIRCKFNVADDIYGSAVEIPWDLQWQRFDFPPNRVKLEHENSIEPP